MQCIGQTINYLHLHLYFVAIKNANFLQKFTLISPVMLYIAVYVKIVSYLHYVLCK